MLYWLLKYIVLGPWFFLAGRPTFEGASNFPNEGAALLAVNHLSASDWLFLPLRSPRRLTFLAKSEYFTGSGLTGKFQRFFFAQTGQVPIDRTDADAATAAMETGARVLAEGQILGMFPEGTRSPDGKLYRGKTGIARVALKSGIPIVPVGLIGTDKFLGADSHVPRPAKIRIRIGEPLDVSPWLDRIGEREAEREVTDEVMRRIQALTGQEYVPDVYGADVKEKLDALRENRSDNAKNEK